MNTPHSSSSERVLLELFKLGLEIHRRNKDLERKCGLSIVQFCLLKHLVEMPGISAQVLAETVGVHSSTLTQTLRRLRKKGYLFIDEDPIDSRKKIISITREGKITLDRAIRLVQSYVQKTEGLEKLVAEIKSCFATHPTPKKTPEATHVFHLVSQIQQL